jgi:hypothetical protein
VAHCTICGHPNRAGIEASPGLGWSVRETCERFGVSRSAYYRHKPHAEATAKERRRRHLDTALTYGMAATWPDTEELRLHLKIILGTLLNSGAYETAGDVLRAVGRPEGEVWRLVQAAAEDRGDDAGEVFAGMYGFGETA